MKIFLATVFSFYFGFCSAQKRYAIWCFGDSAGIDFNNPNNPIVITSSVESRGSCASICDSLGHILFYSHTGPGNGCYSTEVFTKTGSVMANSIFTIGESWYNELLIIPFPKRDSLFYIFSLGEACNFPATGLFYSLIDLNLNGGDGDMYQQNVQLNSLRAVDALCGIKHANGRDWWIINKDWVTDNNTYRFYLVTPSGVSLHHSQNIGEEHESGIGNCTFSVEGTKALITSYNGLIEVMDFNRCTGMFSNPIIIESEDLAPPIENYFGSALSPDGSKIYVTISDSISMIIQFDLDAANIPASKDTVALLGNCLYEAGALRLAPDNKIYMTSAWFDGIHNNYPYQNDSASYNFINMNLSVINSPDSLGSACDFQPYSFYLDGKRTYWGLPNNPNYEMGPVIGSICDSLNVGVVEQKKQNIELDVYPNPTSGKIYLKLNSIKEDKFSLQLLDALGRTLVSEDIKIYKGSNSLELEIGKFPKGIYFLHFKSMSSNEFLKIIMQ